MFIVFLRFGPDRTQAGQWMDLHNQWIQRGIEGGIIFLAGSLENAHGGALIMANLTREEVLERLHEDPFVREGVVTAEIHAVAPSKVSPDMPASFRPLSK